MLLWYLQVTIICIFFHCKWGCAFLLFSAFIFSFIFKWFHLQGLLTPAHTSYIIFFSAHIVLMCFGQCSLNSYGKCLSSHSGAHLLTFSSIDRKIFKIRTDLIWSYKCSHRNRPKNWHQDIAAVKQHACILSVLFSLPSIYSSLSVFFLREDVQLDFFLKSYDITLVIHRLSWEGYLSH